MALQDLDIQFGYFRMAIQDLDIQFGYFRMAIQDLDSQFGYFRMAIKDLTYYFIVIFKIHSYFTLSTHVQRIFHAFISHFLFPAPQYY